MPKATSGKKSVCSWCGKKKKKKAEVPAWLFTCVGRRVDLAGRGGGQGWLGSPAAIKSWYQRSKSSLGMWGLLCSGWLFRAAAYPGKAQRERNRQTERGEGRQGKGRGEKKRRKRRYWGSWSESSHFSSKHLEYYQTYTVH